MMIEFTKDIGQLASLVHCAEQLAVVWWMTLDCALDAVIRACRPYVAPLSEFPPIADARRSTGPGAVASSRPPSPSGRPSTRKSNT